MLPISDFEFLRESEIAQFDIDSQCDSQPEGYILEVDLEYPQELHASHNSFPLAPEKMEIDETMLSPYSYSAHSVIYGVGKYSATKLVSSFLPRKKYVIHYRNLKTYLELGMKLKKIHRILKFKQSFFLKTYVDWCTQKRAEAKNDFGKRLFKLLVNSCYGKFVENVRNYKTAKFCRNKRQAQKWISNPRFSALTIIRRDLIVVFLKNEKIVMNKAYAIGFTILDLSKEFMYREYYTKLKPTLGDCEIFFSDTDSLGIAVHGCKDPIKKISNFIDFSNYPENHPRYNTAIKNQLGYWKDEMKGNFLKRFAGVRSKTYALDIIKWRGKKGEKIVNKNLKNSFTTSTCKGITKSYKKNLVFNDFKKCVLQQSRKQYVTQYYIRSKQHELSTYQIRKLAFSSFDDKRYLFMCGIHSVPYGSKYISMFKKYPMFQNKKCPLC